MVISIIARSKESLDRSQFQNLIIIKGQAKHWHQVLDQLSEGVLLIEPEAATQRKRGEEDNEDSTYAKISYSNNSLLMILNQREKKKDIFGIDVDELLTEIKFKVLFSTN